MKEGISISLTAVLVACALVITGLVVRQELFSSSSSPSVTQTVEDWRQVVKEGYVLGPKNAPVKIIEFFDYQCPYCRIMHPILKQVRKRYPGKVALSYLHFPLKMHEHAYPAALAAECAAQQDRFTRYHNLLLANQERLDEVAWDSLAVVANVRDIEKFRSCVRLERTAKRVRQDIGVGRRIGVDSTPTLLINGTLVSGAIPLQQLNRLIRKSLNEKQ